MKIKKILNITTLGTLSLCSMVPFSSCSCNSSREEFELYPYTRKFFKTPKVASKIVVVNIPNEGEYGKLKNAWIVFLNSLQGVLAQTEARMYVKTDSESLDRWLVPAQEELGFETIEMEPIEAVKYFVSTGQLKSTKYVLYDKGGGNISMNNATVISAAKGYLMVAHRGDFIKIVEDLGFTLGEDANKYTSEQTFDLYKNELNNNMLFCLNPDRLWLRDYAIASKCFVTYLDPEFENKGYLDRILNWVEDNSPVLGWTENEIKYVDILSQYCLAAIGSDTVSNLSLFSGYYPKTNKYQIHKGKIKAQQGKHYVAIIMSDGDNLCWLQENWALDERWYGSKKRGTFPMNWTLNPSFLDLHPQIIEYINKTRTDNDYFVCSHSGYGYANYSKLKNAEKFATSSAEYMKNCDMSISYNLDPTIKETKQMENELKQNQVKGIVWGYGDRYAAAKGCVHWYHNKPIIGIRETLWNLDEQFKEIDFTPTNIANRINKYTTNPKEISGYTLINAHCWNYGNMDNIAELVSKLDSHVEVVTCEQLFDMVIDNVPHIDVDEANDYPEYYKQL